MGRAKIDIKRINNPGNRYTTYNRRIPGLLKKVEEITVLCGVDACVISYGPPSVKTGVSSFHVGCGKGSASVEQIIHRFRSLPQAEQEHKTLDRLRFLDEEIPFDLDRLSPKQLEDVNRQVQAKLHEVEERISMCRPSIQPQQQEAPQHCQLMKSKNSALHFPRQELGIEGCIPNSSMVAGPPCSLPQENNFLNHGTVPIQGQESDAGQQELGIEGCFQEERPDRSSVPGFQEAWELLCALPDGAFDVPEWNS
eukprot:PITA_01173